MSEIPEAYPAYQPRRFPWGCLLGGCAGVILLMIVGIALTGYTVVRFYKNQVTRYTSETPVDLPTLELTPEETAEIEQRVEGFRSKLEKGEAAEPLVLTERDINALIGQEEDLRGRVYVSIEGGQITADVSVPTDILPGAKGRYFNGSLVLDASLENGVLIVKADQASVNGEAVPEEFMREIRGQNLAKDAYKDPETAEWLAKFESMKIVDDTIVLTPAQQQDADSPQDADGGEDASPSEADSRETDTAPTDAGTADSASSQSASAGDSQAPAENPPVAESSDFESLDSLPAEPQQPDAQPDAGENDTGKSPEDSTDATATSGQPSSK